METLRTFITPLTAADIPTMLDLFAEPDVFRYIKRLQHKSRDEYTAYLEFRLDQVRKGEGYYWGVWLKEEADGAGTERPRGAFIGAVNLNTHPGTGKMQIGCLLKKAYWNDGYAYELTRAAVAFGIHEARLPEIYAYFDADNIASGKLVRKLGFQFHRREKIGDSLAEVYRLIAPSLPT